MNDWRTAVVLGLFAAGIAAAAQAPAAGFEKSPDGSYRDLRAGVVFRVPADWTESVDGDTVVLRSPDAAVTTTITTEAATDAATAIAELVADACRGLTACDVDGPALLDQSGRLPKRAVEGTAQSAQEVVQWRADLVIAQLPVLLVTTGTSSAMHDHAAEMAAFRTGLAPAEGAHFSAITEPRPTFQPDASYTEAARAAKFHGTVTLDILIDAGGNVTEARVVNPVGYGLDIEAIKAVRKWRFEPAMQGGVPIATQAQVLVTFRFGN